MKGSRIAVTVQLSGTQTLIDVPCRIARYGYVIPAGESMAMISRDDRRCTDTICPLPVDAHCGDAWPCRRRRAPMRGR
jgi:hypothetical protein